MATPRCNGDRDDFDDAEQGRYEPARAGASHVTSVDDCGAAYPLLRRALADHLCDVCEFVHLGRQDAARASLLAAIAIQDELEIKIADFL